MRSRSGIPFTLQRHPIALCLAAGAAIVTLVSCGGGASEAIDYPAPYISNFSTSTPYVAAGANGSLTANYSVHNGSAVITPGNLAITSNVPLSVGPIAATTTYTLTVTSGAGKVATSTVTINVPAAPVAAITTSVDATGKITKSATGYTASVAAQTGCTYTWTYSNCTITAGTGTNQVTFTAGSTLGAATLTCVVKNQANQTATSTKTLTVVDVAPSALAYSANPASYYQTIAIIPNTPSYTGGAVTGFTVAPALPAGLSLNALTGAITGTATIAVPQTTYVVTAANTGGSTSVNLVVTVLPQPSVNFTAAASPIAPGGGTSLLWNIDSSVASVMITGTDGSSYGPFTASGTQTIAPAANTTYTLVATLVGGGSYTPAPVTVQVDATPLAISKFTGANALRGDSTSLTWTLAGLPLTQTLDGNALATSARTASVVPVRRQMFTLQVTNGASSGNSATATTSVAARGIDWVAGKPGGPGFGNGTGHWASFGQPQSIASDSAGNLYVAEINNNSFRKITPQGVVTTLAGNYLSGSTDAVGAPLTASFNGPRGIFPDNQGYIWLCDSGNGKLRVLTPQNDVKTVTGYGGSSSTNSPNQIVITSNNGTTATGYIADYRVAGIVKVVIDLATMTATPTTILGFTVSGPSGICADANGIVYALDTKAARVQAIKGDVATPLTGHGITFAGPYGVAAITEGTNTYVLVAEPGISTAVDNRVYRFTVDNSGATPVAVASSGIVLAGSASAGAADGAGNVATFAGPQGIAVVGDTAFVVDSKNIAGTFPNFQPATGTSNFWNNTVRKLTNVKAATGPADVVVSTFANASRMNTKGKVPATGTATAADARFTTPQGLAVMSDGSILVADAGNNRIAKITPAGIVTNYPSDSATFTTPISVSLDATGVAFVLEKGATAASVKKIALDGTVSDLGAAGLSANVGALVADPDGTYVYVTDVTKIKQIRVADGVVTSSAATFTKAIGITMDTAKALYVVDGSLLKTVATISTASATTLAGSSSGFVDSATGTSARFNQPNGLVFYTDGVDNYLFVSDFYNSAVRMVELGGTYPVTTLVGRPNATGSTAGLFGATPGRVIGDHTATSPEGGVYRSQSIALTPSGDLVMSVNDTIMQISSPVGK